MRRKVLSHIQSQDTHA